ncbi:MAG: PilZ domain-containing protein [Planctomycetota bacterium]
MPEERPAWDGIERRTYKRFGVKDATVQYVRGGLLSFMNRVSERYYLLNLSVSGCYFITRQQLCEGESLKLQLEAPLAPAPIHIRGKVAWVRKSKDFEAWRVGVEFTKMGEKHRKHLKFVLDNTILRKVDVSTRAYLRDIERL